MRRSVSHNGCRAAAPAARPLVLRRHDAGGEPPSLDGVRALPYRRRMSCRVVCFSGPDGSQMRDVAASVATSLGFTLVDEAIIMRAAAEAGVDPQVVADVE